MIFWDSSALTRCYAPREPGYAHARNLLMSRDRHAASVLVRPEITSAVVRSFGTDRAGRNAVLEVMNGQMRQFLILLLDGAQVDLAVDLIKAHSLRSADALHLASALLAARDLGRRGFRFATADREQAEAARARGLRVVEPTR
ncbi:MAG: PIN domain-containing protein [Planctomycetes bacterium]|nr:PIN domain-containing protein [Planctomycetota bacterium]